MQSTKRAASNRRRTRLLNWVALLMMIAGGAALGWCLAILIDTENAQRLAREQLESMASAITSSSATSTSPATSTRRPRVLVQPETGTPLAELSIPRIGLSAVVLQGSDEHTLRKGVGHIESTSLPGESGNVGIAGHRDSFFRPLRNVQVGDDIWLNTPDAPVHYRVSSFRVVNPTEVSVITPTADAVLTLVTCYPFYFVGSAPDRFIVRASLVRDGEPSPDQPAPLAQVR